MDIEFVAGFGPISPEPEQSRRFWEEQLRIAFEGDDDHRATDKLDGVRAFAIWALRGAAQSCFGTDSWPGDVARPQAWIEFDVESPEAVSAAAAELEERGHRLLRPASMEGWGQMVARLLSPEGLLVGITYTPWMHRAQHEPADEAEAAGADETRPEAPAL